MQNHSSGKSFEVLLINPSSSKGRIGRGQFFTPPMGLAYLASYLQSAGVSVDIIDCDAEEIFMDFFSPSEPQKRQFAELLDPYETPLLVGIGPLTTPFLPNGLAIAKFAKDYFRDAYAVIGGPHPSASPPEMAKRILGQFEYIDAICINEGEKTLLELVTRLRTGDVNGSVEGLVSRSKNGYTYEERKLMDSDELDALPFPNRNLLEKYSTKYRLAVRRNFLKVLSDNNLMKKYGKNPKFTVIFSSRGCPYQCTFCCSLPRRRLRSADNVVSEIESCVDNHDTHCFVFYDDLFTTASSEETERVKDICNLLIEKDLEIFWQVELRADVICRLGKGVLNLMNRAGCYAVNIGIEKATDEALSWLQKGLKADQIRKAIRMIRESGEFIINGTFIFGGAFESKNDVLDIIAFSVKLGLDYAAYYLLEIHPGTVIFEKAKHDGLVDDILNPYIAYSTDYPLFVNPDLDAESLMELQCRAYREFYFNLDHILFLINKVNSVSTVYEQYEHFFHHAFMKRVR